MITVTLPAYTLDEPFTRRQNEMVQLICKGLTVDEIAKSLWLSRTTVSTHLRTMREKLGCKTNVGIYAYAVENGLVKVRREDAMRYFLVFFRADGAHGSLQIQGKGYPHNRFVVKEVKAENPHIQEVIVTNIQELTKEDYDSFLSE